MDERDLLVISASILLASHQGMLREHALNTASDLIRDANAKVYPAVPDDWYATHAEDDPPPF